jgi:hypothetical protein
VIESDETASIGSAATASGVPTAENGWREPFRASASSLELIAYRKLPDSLARRREDRVA